MARSKSQRRPDFKCAKRQATPTQTSQSIRSDGLVLRVGHDGMDPDDALRLTRRIVKNRLPGKWVVQPMGSNSRDAIIRRPAGKRNPLVSQAFDFAYRLRRHRDVEDCEPSLMQPINASDAMRSEREAIPRFSTSSSDSGSSLQCAMSLEWALDLCSVRDAWSLQRPAEGRAQGAGIKVGHPDTGYTNHPDLDASRLLVNSGFDFEDGDADARDTLGGLSGGHGTSTGSVIMSGEGSGPSVVGVAPLANLIPLRVTTSVVLLSFGKLAEAIRFAADQGHHVLSVSLGGPIPSRFLRRAVRYAIQRGVIIVAAAGNIWPFVVHPAKLDEVIAVAACNCRRQIWTHSAGGSAVDVTAPGESVWRALTLPAEFKVQQSSGTSYATAMIAGAAALWLAHHGRDRLVRRFGAANLASVFKELLLTKGFDRPSGWDVSSYGVGILNARKLLAARLPDTAAAGGINSLAATATPRQQNKFDELADLFPASHPAEIRAGLMQMLHTDESQLATVLHDVADEVAFHAVMDMEFRQKLASVGSNATSTSAARSRRTRNKRPNRVNVAPKGMSRHMKRMMEVRD